MVSGGGLLRCALMGDSLASVAQANGWAGVVIWGAVREVESLKNLDIGIKALGSNRWKSGTGGHRDGRCGR